MRTLTQWLNYQTLELVPTQTSMKMMHLVAGKVWRPRGVPQSIICERGVIWLTESGNPWDHILQPEESFLPRRSGIVVQALTEATFLIRDRSNKLALLSRAWHYLVILKHKPELRVWQSLDRFGNTWWHACDSATGESTQLASEVEMRQWVEQRYYKGVG